MTNTQVFITMAAVFGALIGSFLNVCIYRIPIGRSIVRPPSACETCRRELDRKSTRLNSSH